MNNRDTPTHPVPNELEGYYSDPKTCTRFVPFVGMTKYEHVVLEFAKAVVSAGGRPDPDGVMTTAVCLAQQYFKRIDR